MQKLSYKNFIFLSLALALIYALCYFVMRVFLAFSAFEDVSFFALFEGEFLAMLKMGLRLDMRAICVVAAAVLALGILANLETIFAKFTRKIPPNLTQNFNTQTDLKYRFYHTFNAFIYKLTLILSTFSAFLVALSAFISYFYFKTYHTKIDIFAFGLKDDDTKAVLKVILADYPAFKVLFFSILFAFLCFLVAKFCLKFELKFRVRSKFAAVLLNLMLLVLVFIGIRGSLGTFPLREDEHHISANPLINHISTNPIIAFAWACGHYRAQGSFQKPDLAEFEALQNELFSVFRTSHAKISAKPHVVVVLMESFGSNMLYFDDREDFDLLMSFRSHFEAGLVKAKSQNDFVFMNFLSSHNGTPPSFAQLFFESPNAALPLSSAKHKKLDLTPFAVYKKAGYDAIFITSGNRAWQNFGDYLITLGADGVYDSNFLAKHYGVGFLNDYGVADEFAYKFAFELLQSAKNPTFIVILTTANHPPYAFPQNFTPPKFDLSAKFRHFKNDKSKTLKALQIFAYASNAFGDFVQSVKNSSLATHTIIASSGDHKHRDVKAFDYLPLNHAVPLYLYVPSAYLQHFDGTHFGFEPETIGSHKDIFPTLYALSLENADFVSLGGSDLFDKNAPSRFAYNSELWLDKDGYYPANSALGFEFKSDFLLNLVKNSAQNLSENSAKNLTQNLNLNQNSSENLNLNLSQNLSENLTKNLNLSQNSTQNSPQNDFSQKGFKIPAQKAEFMQKYEILNRLQLEVRVFER